MRGFFTVLVVGFLAATAMAAPLAPKVKASIQRDGSVKVRYSIATADSRVATSLELQRADGSGAFAPLTAISAPRRRGNTPDQPPAGGTFAYRARVIAETGTSDWSVPSSAELPVPLVPGPPGDPALPAGLTECPAGYVDEVLALVNDARRQVGRGALRNHLKLARAARIRTIDQASAQNLSHDGWSTTIRQAGYAGGFLAENIAYGYRTPLSVVVGWLNSAFHRGNMLNGYVDSGVGCVVDGRGRIWWTHDFGA